MSCPVGQVVAEYKKERPLGRSFTNTDDITLYPVTLWMHPDRVRGFGSEEVIETCQEIFVSIVLAHAFTVHPDVHTKVFKRLG